MEFFDFVEDWKIVVEIFASLELKKAQWQLVIKN